MPTVIDPSVASLVRVASATAIEAAASTMTMGAQPVEEVTAIGAAKEVAATVPQDPSMTRCPVASITLEEAQDSKEDRNGQSRKHACPFFSGEIAGCSLLITCL